MNRCKKHRGKVAAAIVAAVDRTSPLEPPALPLTTWDELRREQRRLDKAHAKGLSHASRRSAERLRWAIDRLRADLLRLEIQLTKPPQRRRCPAVEVARDLAALEHEFPVVEPLTTTGTITVTTGPIELEGVRLGPFQIKLDWRRIVSQDAPYVIEATDPNPAQANEGVVHPHVSDGRLCEGEAQAAISAALREGRLLDFFLIVRQTLETYNGSSAYVRLEEREGGRCDDCGGWSSGDDRFECESCNAGLCDGCLWSCVACCRTLCNECRAICFGCDEAFCRGCIANGDDGPLCDACRKEQEEDNPSETNDEETKAVPANVEATQTEGTNPGAAVHSCSVGQAGLPA